MPALGDANDAAGVSGPLAVTVGTPDYTLTANPSTATINAGQAAAFTLTVTPLFGFTQAVTFSCGTLPANVVCSFAPASVTPAGAPVNTVLTIQTNVKSALLSPAETPGRRRGGEAIFAALLLLPLISPRLRRRMQMRTLVAVLLLAVGFAGAMGCASAGIRTPDGTSTITVTATGTGASSHTVPITLTVAN